MNDFLKENVKDKGNIVDVQKEIRTSLTQKRDIMKNFDKKNSLKTEIDPDRINPTEKIDEKLSVKIWDAFGQYVAKNMKLGKGINIPKFGNFTFTFPNHL